MMKDFLLALSFAKKYGLYYGKKHKNKAHKEFGKQVSQTLKDNPQLLFYEKLAIDDEDETSYNISMLEQAEDTERKLNYIQEEEIMEQMNELPPHGKIL